MNINFLKKLDEISLKLSKIEMEEKNIIKYSLELKTSVKELLLIHSKEFIVYLNQFGVIKKLETMQTLSKEFLKHLDSFEIKEEQNLIEVIQSESIEQYALADISAYIKNVLSIEENSKDFQLVLGFFLIESNFEVFQLYSIIERKAKYIEK